MSYEEDTSPEITLEEELRGRGVVNINHTFESLNIVQGFSAPMELVKKMASGDASWNMLLICGRSGNGKTHLCEAVIIEMHKQGVWCYRKKWSDIIRYFKAGFQQNLNMGEQRYDDRFHNIRKITRLLIDDVGMGSTGGNWEWGELEDIVDFRLENNLFTIITTNLDLKEIPPRIISRFKDGGKARLIVNEALDYRPKLWTK